MVESAFSGERQALLGVSGVGVDHTVDVEAQHAGTGHVVVPSDVVEPVHVDG